jgi:tetratricopeptide (TPR) repeat protein
MIFKLSARQTNLIFCAFIFIFTLSSCAQLPKSITEVLQPKTAPATDTVDTPNKEDQQQVQAIALTEDELLIQALRARPDSFAITKRPLPESVKARMLEALSLYKQAQYSQSLAVIEPILANEKNINSSVYLLAGDNALALDEKALDTNTSDKNQTRAKQYRNDAIQYYQAALSLNPDNAKAANRLASIWRQQGKFTRAETLYTQAIDAQPMYTASYRNRAIVRDLYLNKKAEALEDYKAYLALLEWEQSQASNRERLSNIKLAKRWVIDVQRQVDAQAKSTQAGAVK